MTLVDRDVLQAGRPPEPTARHGRPRWWSWAVRLTGVVIGLVVPRDDGDLTLWREGLSGETLPHVELGPEEQLIGASG